MLRRKAGDVLCQPASRQYPRCGPKLVPVARNLTCPRCAALRLRLRVVMYRPELACCEGTEHDRACVLRRAG
jgi:hypothetical protein